MQILLFHKLIFQLYFQTESMYSFIFIINSEKSMAIIITFCTFSHTNYVYFHKYKIINVNYFICVLFLMRFNFINI